MDTIHYVCATKRQQPTKEFLYWITCIMPTFVIIWEQNNARTEK